MSNIESSLVNSDVVFKISRKTGTSTENEPTSTLAFDNEESSNSVENDPADCLLCVFCKNGKLGAAYYKITNKMVLYVVKDLIDLQPQFAITRNLLREVNFNHIITMGGICDQYVKFLIDILTNKHDNTVESNQIRKLPPNMSIVCFKDYSYVACELKVLSLNLSSMPEQCTDAQKEIFLQSLLNFDSKMSIHALGALLKFIEANWAHLNKEDNLEVLTFMHINQTSLEDHVYIDKNTFRALQVFQKRSHDANFKHGRESCGQEGTSIFRLFSQHCKSKLGYRYLRCILLNPLKDIVELNKRLDFIEFALQPKNSGFIESLRDSIRKIFDIDNILGKIQHSRAMSSDWEILYKTIHNTLFLHELCGPYRALSPLLSDLDSIITADLYGIESYLHDTLDFTVTSPHIRPAINFGIDEELDKKKFRRQDIGKYLNAAASFTVNQLPEFLTECTVIHIPEMGHLIAIKKPETHFQPNQLEYLGFQFMFEVHNTYHYKSPVCKELDKNLGEIHVEILAHENRIIERLAGLILRCNKDIREPLNIVGQLDCLISMAKVFKEKCYVRPTLNTNNLIDIEEGRHALLELQCSNYVPNDYKSGGDRSRVKIITGPNNSGKTLFLKQSTLIVYLAHVGSYVPAQSANICMVHSIHSRLHGEESASVRLSAFMIDLTQVSQALHNSKANSLVVIDEFGRGTAGSDGKALLGAALKSFLDRDKNCPHVLVSTHFQQVGSLLPKSHLLSYLREEHTEDDDGNIVFLYKISEGISRSFVFDVAESVGLNKGIVDRASEIFNSMQNGGIIKSLHIQNGADVVKNLEYYTNIDIPELD